MDGSEKFLYGLYFGGYATHIQINYEHVFQIPEGMDSSNIPPILCAGITVYAPMKRWIKEAAGAKVGVIGIGGLGHLAVQYGKAMGQHVVAFTTSADKVDYIKKLGAAEVIVVDKELKELAKHENKLNYLVNTLPISSPEILEQKYKYILVLNIHHASEDWSSVFESIEGLREVGKVEVLDFHLKNCLWIIRTYQ